MLVLEGATAREVTGVAPILSVAVPCTPFIETVTVTAPAATPVARPLPFIVATAELLEAQLAVELTSAAVWSPYCAVALNCCVAPSPMLALAGAGESDTKAGEAEPGIVLPPAAWHPKPAVTKETKRAVGIQESQRR